jgi:hypothetical protein
MVANHNDMTGSLSKENVERGYLSVAHSPSTINRIGNDLLNSDFAKKDLRSKNIQKYVRSTLTAKDK